MQRVEEAHRAQPGAVVFWPPYLPRPATSLYATQRTCRASLSQPQRHSARPLLFLASLSSSSPLSLEGFCAVALLLGCSTACTDGTVHETLVLLVLRTQLSSTLPLLPLAVFAPADFRSIAADIENDVLTTTTTTTRPDCISHRRWDQAMDRRRRRRMFSVALSRLRRFSSSSPLVSLARKTSLQRER